MLTDMHVKCAIVFVIIFSMHVTIMYITLLLLISKGMELMYITKLSTDTEWNIELSTSSTLCSHTAGSADNSFLY